MKKRKREKFIFPFVGSLQFVILSISVYTGIINRKSVFIRNKYLTVANQEPPLQLSVWNLSKDLPIGLRALSPTEKVRGCFTYTLTDANRNDG